MTTDISSLLINFFAVVDVISTATHPLRFLYALNSVLGDNRTTGIVVCDFGASRSVLQITVKKLCQPCFSVSLYLPDAYCNQVSLVPQSRQTSNFTK